MFIVNIVYTKPSEIIEQIKPAHRAYLDTGYEKNYLVASGPKKTGDGGILISHLNDRSILDEFIKNDPYRLNDVAKYEVIEFSAVKFHKDFASFLT